MNITFKLATEKDIPTFIALEKSIGNLRTYSNMTDEKEAKDEFKKNIVHFIQYDDEIVGSVEYEIKGPDHAYISGLLVNPKFQGKGIGRETMKWLLKKLQNIKTIDLVTHPDNIVAVNLYKSLGFTIGKRIENYFGDGEPRIILALEKK